MRYAVAMTLAVMVVLATGALPPAARADDLIITVTIKDHKITPEFIRVPAGQPFTLVVNNGDKAPEEFECNTPKKIEELMISLGNAKVNVGPLEAGHYECMGEFHQDTAEAMIVVK
jgi:Cupredoxin-like domain